MMMPSKIENRGFTELFRQAYVQKIFKILPASYQTAELRSKLEARYDDCHDSVQLREIMNLPESLIHVSAN